MNNHSAPHNTPNHTKTTVASKSPRPNLLTLKPPKLIPLTIVTFFCVTLLFFLTHTPSYHSSSTAVSILVDMFHFALVPLTSALSLFLLHRLLEVIIIHHTFRPIHILTIATIILSASIYYYVIELLIIYIVFYLIVGIIFTASFSFQKKHALTTDPAHFRSSLLRTAVASAILGLINLIILALQIIPVNLPWQISGPFFNNLLSVCIITVLPLELALAFLALTKLTPARRTNQPPFPPQSSHRFPQSPPRRFHFYRLSRLLRTHHHRRLFTPSTLLPSTHLLRRLIPLSILQA